MRYFFSKKNNKTLRTRKIERVADTACGAATGNATVRHCRYCSAFRHSTISTFGFSECRKIECPRVFFRPQFSRVFRSKTERTHRNLVHNLQLNNHRREIIEKTEKKLAKIVIKKGKNKSVLCGLPLWVCGGMLRKLRKKVHFLEQKC